VVSGARVVVHVHVKMQVKMGHPVLPTPTYFCLFDNSLLCRLTISGPISLALACPILRMDMCLEGGVSSGRSQGTHSPSYISRSPTGSPGASLPHPNSRASK
jgi:hypothetical protein